ncbi:aroma-sacti cluster domain-containing protein [Edaphobacter aggregans]|uniref:aroma-sacti cluster domain-containing protein n=1 Tax=Edaphobacter aggregans TaxID=570835 RepID=UPI0005592334|nr:aroma-sacti cluster domain-containing protein [Edaphobacter aggregans]
MPESNLEKLTQAGVINKADHTQHNQAAINSLDENEVTTLIKLREKLGAAPAGNDNLRPNFPV